ncbi:Heavy-metal-associated, conserved site [Sesbania bispinosa]|nr:Heavy-metal-associated, conserved site [Sesbania bispinosa]
MQIQMTLFKPLTLKLNQHSRRLNYCTSIRCSAAASSAGGGSGDDDTIVLHVGGMMCEGCADNVKRILESRPQVSSASVNLTSEIAIVSPVFEEKTAPNWQKRLGKALAEHLTSCGFSSNLRVNLIYMKLNGFKWQVRRIAAKGVLISPYKCKSGHLESMVALHG